jgi:hypothetical protein
MEKSQPGQLPYSLDYPPPDLYDPVVEAYKKDVDETLLLENLKLTPNERSLKFQRNMRMLYELRRAGQKSRGEPQASE